METSHAQKEVNCDFVLSSPIATLAKTYPCVGPPTCLPTVFATRVTHHDPPIFTRHHPHVEHGLMALCIWGLVFLFAPLDDDFAALG